MIRSACAISRATEGAGSNVCEFVPSGTIATTDTRSPPTFSMMFRIGDTVVTTRTVVSPSSVLSPPPHAPAARNSAPASASHPSVRAGCFLTRGS